MPLTVPKDLKDALDSVKDDDDSSLRWVVFGYKTGKELKVVGSGMGDYEEMTEALCDDAELHYSIMNSPDGVKKGYCEWTGCNLGGMKRSYILRNAGEIEKLIGYVHHRWRGDDK